MLFGKRGISLTVLKVVNAALGLVLNLGLAVVFGLSREVDALLIAFFLAVLWARQISYVVGVAALPCVVEEESDPDRAGFAPAFRVFALGLALVCFVLLYLAAPWLVKMVTPGFDPRQSAETARLVRTLSPSLLFYILLGAGTAFFHARRHFLLPALGEVLWRLVSIACLFGLGWRYGVGAYAAGVAVAGGVQWLFLVVCAWRLGFSVLPAQWRCLRWTAMRAYWKGGTVVSSGVLLRKGEEIADRVAVSFMAAGAMAAFSYAGRLAFLLPSLLSTAFFLPLAPEVPRIKARMGDPAPFAKQAALFLASLGVPLGLVIFWASRDLVEFLLVRGRFDREAAGLVASGVRAFALGVPALFCVKGLRGLYVMERNLREIVRIGLLAVAARVLGNVFLMRFGPQGIALSGSLTMWLVAAYLWVRTRTPTRTAFAWVRAVGASAALAGILFLVPWRALLPWSVLRLGVGAGVGLAVYGAVMWPAIRRVQAFMTAVTSGAEAPGQMAGPFE